MPGRPSALAAPSCGGRRPRRPHWPGLARLHLPAKATGGGAVSSHSANNRRQPAPGPVPASSSSSYSTRSSMDDTLGSGRGRCAGAGVQRAGIWAAAAWPAPAAWAGRCPPTTMGPAPPPPSPLLQSWCAMTSSAMSAWRLRSTTNLRRRPVGQWSRWNKEQHWAGSRIPDP